ncbi:MAG: methyltransferase domain-containing protein [Dokdonella sp.]
MNALQRFEYVALRLVRRFFFNEKIANRLARWLPYYAPSVGEHEPERIIAQYAADLAQAGRQLAGMRVLEVGAGRTNGVGYGLVAAGAVSASLLEPFVEFDAQGDQALRQASKALTDVDTTKVCRSRSFAQIAPASIDLLLSNSVLEHVRDTAAFFADCARVLAPGGVMLHRVDYRDHFFKYPYGFLTFSDATWSRWLDPGDLPRWRLSDHLSAMRDAGFDVSVFDRQTLPDAFDRVRRQLTGRFAQPLPDIDVTGAVLLAHVSA